ncbi:MAG: radical SAM protein [Desulfobacterales bacterium]
MKKKGRKKQRLITAVVANPEGEIFELEGYAAVGMAGPSLVPLTKDDTVDLPFGSEQMLLPDRSPIVYHIETDRFETLKTNPYTARETIFPVAAFNSPGYMIRYVSAYREKENAGYLPLFSYGAVGWYDGAFRSSVIQVDRERRQDLRLMKPEDVLSGIDEMRRKMPANRLRQHLEKCALTYGCPAGKNFFLGRFEAPLPTSRQCNAQCLGCISLQDNDDMVHCQERIGFTPSPEEITEVALAHIARVKHAVVSFGQGCEGDPLLAAHVIAPAIRMIRSATGQGTINMNTNGSRPDVLKELFDAGLDSIRVSLNSVREPCYNAYFRPRGYQFSDVVRCLDMAADRRKFSSINYLNCPGFTDTPEETEAVVAFIEEHRINHVQWRNLNYDPVRYWKVMDAVSHHGKPLGMKKMLRQVTASSPDLTYGYFNPPKEKWNDLATEAQSPVYG